MSRNNSVSTTTSTTSTTSTSTSTTFSTLASTTSKSSLASSLPTNNHIISDFNPTLVLHIPSHGALKRQTATGVQIHDLTPWLPGYSTSHSLSIPESVSAADIRVALSARQWAGADRQPALVSRRNSRWSSRSTISAAPAERLYADVAEWKVPWDIMKPSTITLRGAPASGGGGGEKRIEVWCGKEDRRAQVWAMEGGISFVWKWEKEEGREEELVLVKEGGGMGSHRVGAFLLKHSQSTLNPLSPSSGTLILDERGLSRTVAVASILIFLKRDRQRRSVGGRT